MNKLKLLLQRKIQLQPARIDAEEAQDELMQAILNDQHEHDNKWQLNEFVDAEEASRIWHELENEESR